MARKIESLLRVMSDMQCFESGDISAQKRILSYTPDELTEDELDLVAAATQEPNIPDFLRKENL